MELAIMFMNNFLIWPRRSIIYFISMNFVEINVRAINTNEIGVVGDEQGGMKLDFSQPLQKQTSYYFLEAQFRSILVFEKIFNTLKISKMETPLQLKIERFYQKFMRGEICLHIMAKADLTSYLEGLKLYKPQQTRLIACVETIIEQDKINSPHPFWVQLKKSLKKKKDSLPSSRNGYSSLFLKAKRKTNTRLNTKMATRHCQRKNQPARKVQELQSTTNEDYPDRPLSFIINQEVI